MRTGGIWGRRWGVRLHWAVAVLAVATAVASDPGTRVAMGTLFAIAGGAFVLRALVAGPLTPAGPRLSGSARLVHYAVHRGLLAAVGLTVATGLAAGMAGPEVAAAIGLEGPSTEAWHWRAYTALFVLSAAHLVFNIWRGAEGDRPFSRMIS